MDLITTILAILVGGILAFGLILLVPLAILWIFRKHIPKVVQILIGLAGVIGGVAVTIPSGGIGAPVGIPIAIAGILFLGSAFNVNVTRAVKIIGR